MKQVERMTVELTFIKSTLGLCASGKSAMEEYIASKAPTQEKTEIEMKSIPDTYEEKHIQPTVFCRDATGALFVWSYQMKGFIKGNIESLIELGDCKISKWAFKKAVGRFVHISPERIYLMHPDGQPWIDKDGLFSQVTHISEFQGKPGILLRSIRCATMQGDRVSIRASEALPAGTWCQFTVRSEITSNPKANLAVIDRQLLKAVFDRGMFEGFSQWKTGEWGRFTWEEIAFDAS